MGFDAVNRAQALSRQHLPGRSISDDGAFVEQDQARAPARSEAEIVQRRDHPAPFPGKLGKQPHQCNLVRGVEPRRRLVGKQERRILRQRAGNQHPCLFAARKLGRRAMAKRFQFHAPDRFLDLRPVGGIEAGEGRPMRRPAERNHGLDGNRPADLALLWQIGDAARPLPRGHRGDILPGNRDFSLRRDEPESRPKQRGLARTVGADQAHELTFADAQGNTVQYRSVPKRSVQIFHRQQAHSSVLRVR